MAIKLGSHVKDTISGFTGVVVAETNWLYGCRRLTIAGDFLHEGKPVETQCFDEPQLQVIKAKDIKSNFTGGMDRKSQPRTGL